MTELTIPVSMDGPYSPEQTQQVAHAVAEGIRYLNHCSHPGNDGGLEYPGDVYDLLGHLYTATGRLPQLFVQLTGFLDGLNTENLADDRGRAVTEQIAETAFRLGHAHQVASDLTDVLRRAQSAISGLYVKGGSDD